MGFLVHWLVNAIGIYLAAMLLPGLEISGARGAIIAALILGLVNATVRWVILILTLPLNILTLGLLTLVINALMLYLVATIVPGALKIKSFGAALVGALIISVISTVLGLSLF